jgi:hypothetical protein
MGSNDVKVWAVSAVDGSAGVARAFSKRLNSLGSAGGAGLEYKNNVLTVNINSGQMTCPANGLFYLVIQIKDGSSVKVGQISIA